MGLTSSSLQNVWMFFGGLAFGSLMYPVELLKARLQLNEHEAVAAEKPDDPAAQALWGERLLAAEEYERAIPVLRHAVTLLPQTAHQRTQQDVRLQSKVEASLIKAYEKTGRNREIIELFETRLRENGRAPISDRIQLAEKYRQFGDLPNALVQFRIACARGNSYACSQVRELSPK